MFSWYCFEVQSAIFVIHHPLLNNLYNMKRAKFESRWMFKYWKKLALLLIVKNLFSEERKKYWGTLPREPNRQMCKTDKRMKVKCQDKLWLKFWIFGEIYRPSVRWAVGLRFAPAPAIFLTKHWAKVSSLRVSSRRKYSSSWEQLSTATVLFT